MTKRPGLTKIQIARRQLGMDDDTYRAMLKRTVGAESSKGLTPRQVGRVLAELERLGFEPTGKAKMPTDRQIAEPPPERKALVYKIAALLNDAGRPWAYADAMAKRMFQVDSVEWCEPGQLHSLVAALTYDAKRQGAK